MGEPLTLVNETKKTKLVRRARIWRERPITDEDIFYGTDECGRSGWFLRLTVTGLYPRRVGPYRTERQAIEVLEEFIADLEVEPLCELSNDMTIHQAYMIEGVPPLVGHSTALSQENT